MTSKIAAILMTFTEGSEHSLAQIAARTGLPISTAHRLTAELASRRLLERTSGGRYRAGLPLRTLGGAGPSPATIVERAPFVLDDVGAATRCRTRLGVLRDLRVAYIEKEIGSRPISPFTDAATLPAHPTALGRVLLAFGPARLVEAVIRQGLRPYTEHTVTSPDRFRRALAVTRLTRVSVTRCELEGGVYGVAMPVFGPGGDVVAGIEVAVHDLPEQLPSVLAVLAIACRSLSREISSMKSLDAVATAPPGRGALIAVR